MIKAILYSSCTGSCKKYAQMMSEATGVPAYPVKEYKAKFPREKVAYVGWLFGGFVMGLGKARVKGRVKAVCQVGMGPETPALEPTARKKNCLMKGKTKQIAAGLKQKEASTPLSDQEQATLTMAFTGNGDPAKWDISRFENWFNSKKK